MNQELASKSVARSPQTPVATTNVFSRQVQSPPPPAVSTLRLKTVQYQQAGMPYMTGAVGPPVEPIGEPWYSKTTDYCCYLPFWAGAIIWIVAGLMLVLIFIRVETKPNPVED